MEIPHEIMNWTCAQWHEHWLEVVTHSDETSEDCMEKLSQVCEQTPTAELQPWLERFYYLLEDEYKPYVLGILNGTISKQSRRDMFSTFQEVSNQPRPTRYSSYENYKVLDIEMFDDPEKGVRFLKFEQAWLEWNEEVLGVLGKDNEPKLINILCLFGVSNPQDVLSQIKSAHNLGYNLFHPKEEESIVELLRFLYIQDRRFSVTDHRNRELRIPIIEQLMQEGAYEYLEPEKDIPRLWEMFTERFDNLVYSHNPPIDKFFHESGIIHSGKLPFLGTAELHSPKSMSNRNGILVYTRDHLSKSLGSHRLKQDIFEQLGITEHDLPAFIEALNTDTRQSLLPDEQVLFDTLSRYLSGTNTAALSLDNMAPCRERRGVCDQVEFYFFKFLEGDSYYMSNPNKNFMVILDQGEPVFLIKHRNLGNRLAISLVPTSIKDFELPPGSIFSLGYDESKFFSLPRQNYHFGLDLQEVNEATFRRLSIFSFSPQIRKMCFPDEFKTYKNMQSTCQAVATVEDLNEKIRNMLQ